MKIRLVIPECKKFSGGYSKNSVDIDQRLEILKIATQESDKIGLIVTSHNFFGFNPNIKVNDFDAKKFIIKNIVPNLQEKIENKKPLVIGFDLLKLRFKHPKKQKSKGKDKGAFNPYHGIDSIVCYIKVKNNSYVYQTHIWECWQSEGECNPVYFEKQNKNRVFSLDNKLIGLLSCGDISNSCHDYGKLLQEVDVYLDLSHYSLRGDTSQRKVSPKLVDDWNRCDYVLVTQQVKDVSTYLKYNKYPYIFPQDTAHKIKELCINGERKGVLIDVDIQ